MTVRDQVLVCHACGSRTREATVRCACGEPLWFPIEPVEIESGTPASIWDYEGALPVNAPTGLGSIVGGTPTYRVPTLDASVGCRVHIKDERGNPTGTFKDRGSAVGVAIAANHDAPVITVSHGNMARSVAAHAVAAGVQCAVLVPADIPGERLGPIARYDPALLRVDGDYGQLYDDAIDIVGPIVLNSDVPLRVAGQKTLAYELASSIPSADAVVLPVSSGGNASAIWKGYREVLAAGMLDAPPPLYLVQASGCAPIATAFEDDEEQVTAVEPAETIAYSIANPDPPSGNRALRAARETGGAVVSVDDEAIRRAQDRLAQRAGITAEPAAATVIAGMHRLGATETLRPTDDVVAVITGTGLLDQPDRLPDAPVVDRESVSRALRNRFRG
jgi:threonine synthase